MSAVLDSLPQLPAKDAGKTINGKRIRVPPRITLGEITPNNVGTLKKLNLSLFPISYSDRFYRDVLDPAVTPEEYSRLVFYQDVPVGNLICRIEPASAPAPTTISASGSSSRPTVEASDDAAPKANGVGANGDHACGPEPSKLYIMTLGILSPYRRQGLATKLVSYLVSAAESSHIPPPAPPVTSGPDDKSKSASPAATSKAKGKDAKGAATVAANDDKKSKDAKDEVKEPVKSVIESLYLHVQVSNTEAREFWEKVGFTVTDTVKDYYRKLEPKDAWLLERKIGKPSAAS